MQSGLENNSSNCNLAQEDVERRGSTVQEEFVLAERRSKSSQNEVRLTKDAPRDIGAISKFLSNVHRCAQRVVLPRSQHPTVTDGDYDNQYMQPFLPIAVFIISVAEVAVFIHYVHTCGEELPSQSPLIYNPKRRYEAWRYLSYMLIHSGYMHIIVNIFIQLVLGIALEMVHGHWRVCLVYISGVVAGSLGTSIADPVTYLSGASGGVYSLIAAHFSTIIMNYAEMDHPILQLLVLLLVVAADTGHAIYSRYIIKDLNNRTSYAAHFAGAMAGLLMGIVALRNLKKHKWEKVLQWICLSAYIVLMGAVIIWNAAVPSYFPASE